MTSRRPVTSYSGNGRYSSQNGDDVLSPRLDGRNYLSSVRPENRSTFCTVMSQLTEDTQPCFETTIKSKAVSEACNVKFSCVVTGYPVPELTWYKDDMELDRYCGLPKYEIFQSGKIHTLHIYNCTVDDAAIYQVSARNSKGIVSCSGVLEVGTMSEYKIHQRFFAKLKQKAEQKRREMEHSNCQEKETIYQEHVSSSQNNVRWIDGLSHNTYSSQIKEDNTAKVENGPEEDPEAPNEELNRISVKVHRYPMRSDQNQENDTQHMTSDVENENQQLICDTEKADVGSTTLSTKEKEISNIAISNGKVFTTQPRQDAREGNDVHEEMSLAKILVESLQLKLCDENKKTIHQSTSNIGITIQERKKKMDNEWEEVKDEDTHQVWESSWKGEQEMFFERKEEDLKQPEPEHSSEAASETKTYMYKEPEYQHKSALSSVFHSLKDIFFGKSKKTHGNSDSCRKENLAANTEAYCHFLQPQYDTLGVSGTVTAVFQEIPLLQIQSEMEIVNLDNHIDEFTTKATKNIPQVSKTILLIEEEKEAGPEALQNNTLSIIQASDDHSEPNNGAHIVQMCPETTGKECTAATEQMMQGGGEIKAVKQQDNADIKILSTASMLQSNMTNRVDEVTLLVPNSCVHKDSIRVDERIQDSIDVAIEKSTKYTECSEKDTADAIEETTISIYDKEQSNAIPPDKSDQVHDMSHMECSITENRNSVANNFMKNMHGFDANTVRHVTNKLEKTCSTAQRDNNIEAKNDIIGMKQEHIKKKISTKTKQTINIKEEITAIICEQDTAIPESNKQPEILETHLREEKKKIFKKVQADGHVVESRDQAAIIILPDTRETVIKNVAKMRAAPFTPEIKSTVPEKVKQEDIFCVPKIDVLLAEHERVSHPIDHEIQNSISIVSDTKDGIEVIAVPIDVTHQNEKDAAWLTPDQRNIEDIKNLEAKTGDYGQLFRVTDNSIPIISVACADEITPFQDQEKKYEISVFQDTVHQNNLDFNMQDYSLIPTTQVESSIKKETKPEALTIILREIKDNFNSEDNHNTKQVVDDAALKNKATERKDIQVNSDVSSVLSKSLKNITACDTEVCPDKEIIVEHDANRLQNKPAMEKLGLTTPVGPTLPPLSPASLRKLMAKNNQYLESQSSNVTLSGDKSENSGGSTPTSTLSCDNSPKMKRRDSLTLIPSATPEELASGARRKIYLAKTKSEDEGSDIQSKRDSQYMSPSQIRRAAFLQLQSGQQAHHIEKRSPLLGRCKTMVEVQKPKEEEETGMSSTESKLAQNEKLDPYKAPQVIRKIRGEPFSDALGHLKLWCQFFNVLCDSTVKWFKDDVEIAEIKRSAGDESQVALAIVQASSRDCGVYGCTIKNDYGTDATDYLLSPDILAEFLLRDDLEVWEEIEMTPLLFNKGLVDPSYWGKKFFGRIMTEDLQIAKGCAHKITRAKVIYGLDPIFDSGSTCIVKVRNQIAYGTNEENCLAEINLEITKQECKIHNTVREYCKIFAAETRVIDKFGFALEVIPLYLIYRPANTIPYATIGADLKGEYLTYCMADKTERMLTQCTSEVGQKCCTFQHWIYQWTNGNLLVTQLEGVDTKITNVKIATKSKGYQNLTDKGSPKILEQFIIQHQCNYYCQLLGLRSLTTIDSLQQSKIKTSRSPMVTRRVTDSSSPQLLKKCSSSTQLAKNINSSPKLAKKAHVHEENNPATNQKIMEVNNSVEMR